MASSENHGRTVNEKSTTQTAQAALSERVDTLAAELDIERQRRHQLETALDAERTARKQLERDLKDERTHRKEVDSLIEALRRRVTTLSDSLFGADGSAMAYEAVLTEYPPLIEVIEQYNPTAIEALEADLQDETDRVAADTAKLRRELHLLAGEVDVDLTDSAVCGDDKITRVIRNGPEAVETTVNPVDRRAAAILSNIDRWGQRTTDAYGERFVLTARVAKDRLQDTHDESLASSQLKRVFEKLQAWGRDSPRTVSADFSGKENRLLIEITAEA